MKSYVVEFSVRTGDQREPFSMVARVPVTADSHWHAAKKAMDALWTADPTLAWDQLEIRKVRG